MKKTVIFSLALLWAVVSNSQILYVPNGTSAIGTSTTTGIGIGLNNPVSKLDIQATANQGGLVIKTTKASFPAIGGGITIESTPYAFKVQYQQTVSIPATDQTVALLNARGVLSLGDFGGISPISSNFLNVKNGMGLYASANTYLTLQANTNATSLNWVSGAANSNYKNLNFTYNNGTPIFSLTSEGKTGIGTETPTTALHVVDNRATNTTGSAVYGLQINNNGWRNEDYAVKVNTVMGTVFRLANNGHMYLGPNLNGVYNGNYRLYVETGIRTEKIRVDIAADNGWADFVFDEGYELMSTHDLAVFIAKNKHLPNVPSEKQVREEGIDLAEMNAILLRQIEELTLRVIELENRLQ